MPSSRSNPTVEERRRKVKWAEEEIGKAAAEDNAAVEARDAIGTASEEEAAWGNARAVGREG